MLLTGCDGSWLDTYMEATENPTTTEVVATLKANLAEARAIIEGNKHRVMDPPGPCCAILAKTAVIDGKWRVTNKSDLCQHITWDEVERLAGLEGNEGDWSGLNWTWEGRGGGKLEAWAGTAGESGVTVTEDGEVTEW